MAPFIDHVDLRVSNLAKVRRLYDALLPAMGYSCTAEDEHTINYDAPGDDRAQPFFAIDCDPDHRPNATRIAFRADSRAELERLAEVARGAGATAFEPPHHCTEYTPNYYATFFEDADGNKFEICYRVAPE